jgi:5-formyltetrahydrofolate cyclo-ligase
MVKDSLRLKLRKSLERINKEQRAQKSKKACQNLISTPQFQDASVIMMFLSLPDEIDTTEAIQHGWHEGKTIIVPKVYWEEKYMIPVKIDSFDDAFSTEVAGLRNPVTDESVPLEQIDLVVTPALGFDRTGHRIGRSGGFYDRFFSNEKLRAKKCGFGFKEQVLETDLVPAAVTDVPVDFLVTDEQIIYFDKQ